MGVDRRVWHLLLQKRRDGITTAFQAPFVFVKWNCLGDKEGFIHVDKQLTPIGCTQKWPASSIIMDMNTHLFPHQCPLCYLQACQTTFSLWFALNPIQNTRFELNNQISDVSDIVTSLAASLSPPVLP